MEFSAAGFAFHGLFTIRFPLQSLPAIPHRPEVSDMPENDIPLETLDQDIRRNRTVHAEVSLTHTGRPLAGREVTVAQRSHAFLFGSNWGDGGIELANGELDGADRERAERRGEHFLRLFNQVTLPFYWARFEPERGKPDTRRIRKTADWYRRRGCRIKGHPLCWHTLTAGWLLGMSEREILKAQRERIRRDATDFTGIVDAWDVVNEAVIMPVFDRYDNGITRLCRATGRIELIRAMFEEARAADPHATLLLNDFDVSSAFDILVEGCLEAGIRIDAIGIQSHMHQGYWGSAKTLAVIEHFTRFGLPIHFTENTIVSGHLMPPEIVDLNDYRVDDWPSTPAGEQRQAEEVVRHYKTLFSHPSVQGVTWWDLTDGGWLNAPAGLLHHDQTPKPAYDALAGLIRGEWWLPPTILHTDPKGLVHFSGFPGEYTVTVDDRTQSISLPEPGEAKIHLEIPD
jgi:GH35 family endo-1,4-beta-xylanase